MKKMIIKNNHNYLVDIIRFIAASLVIFSHSFPLSRIDCYDYISRFISGVNFGSIAVAIFFSISGFFITNSLVKKGSKNYVKNRLKKILPELIFVVLLCVFILGPLFSNLKLIKYFENKNTYLYLLNCLMIPIHNLPGVFTNNIYGSTVNGALWTLSVEFLCYIYILIIFKLKLLNKEKIKYVFIFSFISSIIAYYILLKLNLNILIAMIRPFLVFIFSSLLFFYKDHVIKNKYYWLVLIVPLLLIIIPHQILFNGILIFVLPILLVKFINISNKINNNLIRILGNISYSMYLVGFVIQQSVVSLYGGTMNPYINFLISLPLSIIFGIIVYYVVNFIMKRLKLA